MTQLDRFTQGAAFFVTGLSMLAMTIREAETGDYGWAVWAGLCVPFWFFQVIRMWLAPKHY
jgi:hypothetical protein